MGSALQALLIMLGQIIPSMSGNVGIIATIIEALTKIVPLVVSEVKDVTPMVKNIIAALKADPAVTADLLTQLDALDAQCDAAFEAAAVPKQGDPDYVPPAA